MLKEFGGINNLIYYVLLVLLTFIGFKIANKIVDDRKKHRSSYYTIALVLPGSFLASFFIIDSLSSPLNIIKNLGMPYSIIAYWMIIVFTGSLISIPYLFYSINEYKKNRRNNS